MANGMKIGTIEADITADTSGLDRAEREWKQKGKSLETTFDRAGTQVGRQFQTMGQRARAFASSFRPMRGAVQQAAFQMQDFAVQVGAGTNAMVSFSQQAPQLLGVFGPGGAIVGAVVGVAAALGGSLVPALFSSRDAMEELEATTDELDEILNRAADGGVDQLTEKLVRLAAASREAAQAEVFGGILKAEEQISTAAAEAADAVAGILRVEFGGGRAETEIALSQLARQIGITQEQARELAPALRAVGRDASRGNVEALQDTIDRLAASTGTAAPALLKLREEFGRFAGTVAREGERLDRLREIGEDLDAGLAAASAPLERAISDSLGRAGETQVQAIQRNAEEARQKVRDEELLTADARERLLDQINENELIRLREHWEGRTEASAREIERGSREIMALERKAAKEQEKARQDAAREAGRVETQNIQISQLDETDLQRINRQAQERRQFVMDQEQLTGDRRMELLRSIHNRQLEETNTLNDELLEQERKAQERREQQAKASAERQANLHATLVGNQLQALQTLGDQANDIIAATGQEGTAIAKAIFLAQKAIYIAQIIASTEAAAATASAFVAGGGPIAWLASREGIRTLGYASAGIVAGLSVGSVATGGGRQFGGPVSPQLAHPINEGGVPEILNMAGRQFLLPTGQGGTIEPMRAGAGGGRGGAPSVTVYNQGTPQQYEVDSYSADEIRLIARDEAQRSEGRINASLATGRGDTAASLRRGYRVERNLR